MSVARELQPLSGAVDLVRICEALHTHNGEFGMMVAHWKWECAMSHRTRTAPDCEAVEGVPDFLLLDRASCEHRLYLSSNGPRYAEPLQPSLTDDEAP